VDVWNDTSTAVADITIVNSATASDVFILLMLLLRWHF
jgi:hypothetical protein